jgi:exodeoxyribonuclease-5
VTLELTGEQQTVVNDVIHWFKYGPSRVITIGGYAGTGKTTIIPFITDGIKEETGRRAFSIAYCAYTGKASFVMETKLQGTIGPFDSCSTIHALLYYPVFKTNKKGKKVISHWKKKTDLEDVDLIIVDEASMVNSEIWSDLSSYNVPIIAIGDHGQLPPIGGKFNLMKNPDIILTKIHRQALNNPIIKMSIAARKGQHIQHGMYSNSVFKMDWRDPRCQRTYKNISWDADIICLSGINATRVKVNSEIRAKLGYSLPTPYPGERVMCLKNNHNAHVMNGQLGTLVWDTAKGKDLTMGTIMMDGFGELYESLMYTGAFGLVNYDEVHEIEFKKKYGKQLREEGFDMVDLFDFGYATTVHKSQGSEWDRVVLLEQRNRYQTDEDFARWLYTGITRAKSKLFIITSYW